MSNTGSYVTWRDPSTGDWTTVLETINSTGPWTFALCPAAGDNGVKHPSQINVAYSDQNHIFAGYPSISVGSDGCYTTTVAPDTIYTFTTLNAPNGPFHGAAPTPPPASSVPIPYPNPYLDDFDGTGGTINSGNCSHPTYAVGDTPCWMSDIEGAFQVEPCAAPRTGNCLQQEITDPPIRWRTNLNYGVTTVAGDVSWADYDTSARIRLASAGAVRLQGYVSPSCEGLASTQCTTIISKSYSVDFGTDGTCTLSRFDNPTPGSSPYVPKMSCGQISINPGEWHTYGMRLQNNGGVPSISIYLDGTNLGTYVDTEAGAILHGAVAFGASDWISLQLDDVCISITNSCT